MVFSLCVHVLKISTLESSTTYSRGVLALPVEAAVVVSPLDTYCTAQPVY